MVEEATLLVAPDSDNEAWRRCGVVEDLVSTAILYKKRATKAR